MLKTYDTVILGCGEAGVFAGYELIHRNPGMKVLIVDQGQDIYHRSCPIVAGKVKSCIDCKVCHTMCGFGGAGAFSDGKYNFTTAFGGWLTDFIPEKEVMDLIDYVDEINTAHGATREVFSTNTPEAQALRKRALESDLHLLQARVKHLGTENNLRILTNIYEDLRKNIDFQFNTAVTEIRQAEGGYLLETANGDEYLSKYLIAAPGRSGAEWFAHQCQKLGLPMTNNQIDIGVRVELPALVFEHITDVVYESKLIYRTKQYGDQVRTFCMNPYGHVVSENVEGIHTVNGHSYSDPKLRSENTNFALFSLQPLHGAVQRAVSLRQAHRLSLQHAGRRRAGPALRRPDPRRALQRPPHEQVHHAPHPDRRRPRRPVPGPAQAAAGRHH